MGFKVFVLNIVFGILYMLFKNTIKHLDYIKCEFVYFIAVNYLSSSAIQMKQRYLNFCWEIQSKNCKNYVTNPIYG